jgi:DNA helicase TIP49 (TBP-interacting protein)
MISSFNIVGIVEKIHPKHKNQFGDSVAITLLSNNDDHFFLISTGKVMTVVEEKLREGDLVYIDGRLRVDRNTMTPCPKNVLAMFINYLTILPTNP